MQIIGLVLVFAIRTSQKLDRLCGTLSQMTLDQHFSNVINIRALKAKVFGSEWMYLTPAARKGGEISNIEA